MTKSNKKRRDSSIFATTKREVSEISLTVDRMTGEILFGQEMTNVYSEVSYGRPKGPKVLSRIPQEAPLQYLIQPWRLRETTTSYVQLIRTHAKSEENRFLWSGS